MDVQAYERSYTASNHPQDDADTYLLPMIVIRPEALYKLFAALWQKLYVKEITDTMADSFAHLSPKPVMYLKANQGIKLKHI